MHKIDENSTPASHLGSWMKKALCSGAVLGLAMSMGTTSVAGSNKDKGEQFNEFTPVNRIAEMPVVRDERGKIDYRASYAKARAASVALATYVATMDESAAPLELPGGDWKLGGTSKDCIENLDCSDHEIDVAVLMIPSPEPIDPTDSAYMEDGTVTKENTKKANVLDFCNGKYAGMAMGVTPIVKDMFVVNGYSHAPALPCEVSIWLDDNKINVDMLNPEAIFTLFFSDVLFSDEMQDPEFADALGAMTLQVKKEIKTIIHTALSESDLNLKMKIVDKEIGPVYDSMDDIIQVVASSTYQSPYMHMSYTKVGGGIFTETESKAVAQTIIDTLSTDEDNPGVHPTRIKEDLDGNRVVDINDDHNKNLDDVLSINSSWRSARLEPISIPGKNHIIEACSPKYAKMAMGTGLSHVNALPCEITVKIIDSGDKLVVSYLDPDFMLKSMFADISDEDKAAFGDIPELIMTDLQNIVKAALEVNSGIEMNPGVQISFDMLP